MELLAGLAEPVPVGGVVEFVPRDRSRGRVGCLRRDAGLDEIEAARSPGDEDQWVSTCSVGLTSSRDAR